MAKPARTSPCAADPSEAGATRRPSALPVTIALIAAVLLRASAHAAFRVALVRFTLAVLSASAVVLMLCAFFSGVALLFVAVFLLDVLPFAEDLVERLEAFTDGGTAAAAPKTKRAKTGKDGTRRKGNGEATATDAGCVNVAAGATASEKRVREMGSEVGDDLNDELPFPTSPVSVNSADTPSMHGDGARHCRTISFD